MTREDSSGFTQLLFFDGPEKGAFPIEGWEEESNSANLNSISGKQSSTLTAPFVSPNRKGEGT